MSYHEIRLAEHEVTISYGGSLTSWDLPLSLSVGGSGVHERGFQLGFLCVWVAVNWWPKSYPVPLSAQCGDADHDWSKQFSRVEDAGYQIEAVDIEAGEILALAQRLRNAVSVLRDIHYADEEDARCQPFRVEAFNGTEWVAGPDLTRLPTDAQSDQVTQPVTDGRAGDEPPDTSDQVTQKVREE